MARDPGAIAAALAELLEPDARGRLLARGMARGILWRNGVVPPGTQPFLDELTDDLLEFGYGILAHAVELRDANYRMDLRVESEDRYETAEAFRIAAESIEAAVRRGDSSNQSRGFHLLIASASYHLAGYAARSFTLMPDPGPEHNLSSAEKGLAFLLRRDLIALRMLIHHWFELEENSDQWIARRLSDVEDEYGPEDAVVSALSRLYFQGLGLADTGLFYGDAETHEEASAVLRVCIRESARVSNVPLWWVATLTWHILRDLWDDSLHVRLPDDPGPGGPARWAYLRRDFISMLAVRTPPQVDLWPSQISAAKRAVDPNDDLVVSLPTSAGKTRIAELAILRTLADEKRIIYVTPLRALSAQVEKTLARTFVPLGASVTSLYGASGVTLGEAKTLADADIVVATPEKVDFAIRQDPDVLDDVSLIVFDEGHMIGLGSREIRYEVLIQRLLQRADAGQRRLVCLSAMFNPEDRAFSDFKDWLRSDEPGDAIHVDWRPTRQLLAVLDWRERSGQGRLEFIEGEKPFVPRYLKSQPPQKRRRKAYPKSDVELCIATVDSLASDGQNVLVYSPQRRLVEPLVREFCTIGRQGYLQGIPEPDEAEISVALAIGKEWLGEGHPAVEGLRAGVGTHHGTLPRPFQSAIEDLLLRKVLSVVVASPTLAQGIDLACGTLVFRSIWRFDRKTNKQKVIRPSEFANVLGRAGRAYVDLDGTAIFPIFMNHRSRRRHFNALVRDSRAQRLWSGLARLVRRIGLLIQERLEIEGDQLLEYVLNRPGLWSDESLVIRESTDDDDQRSLVDYIADLDVAILSLVEPLTCSIEDLADVLDRVLTGSLWARTVSTAGEVVQEWLDGLLKSRARWLWSKTSVDERSACFSAGLGMDSGCFLYRNLDDFCGALAEFQDGVVTRDPEHAVHAAIQFADLIMQDRFFAPHKLPGDWREALSGWIRGVPFADILTSSDVQSFIHEGVIFKFVWAAEAVRVQATAIDHAEKERLGDGPALCMTHGVPSIPAALLCQSGFSSRAGAVWATSQISADFSDLSGMREWTSEHRESLGDRSFWEEEYQYDLWVSNRRGWWGPMPQEWEWRPVRVDVTWADGQAPEVGTRMRLLGQDGGGGVAVCDDALRVLGKADLKGETLDGVFTKAKVVPGGGLRVAWFGPVKEDE